MAEDNVLPPLDLEVLLHVLPDHFDLEVRSLAELVNDQMGIITTEVVEEYRNLEADRALQVTLMVHGADEVSHDVVVITDFGALRLAPLEIVAAYVAPRGIVIHLLACTQTLHLLIRPENLHNLRLPLNKHVETLRASSLRHSLRSVD